MKPIITALAIVIFLFSCNKNEADPTPAPSKTDLATSSKWKYENGGIDANNDGSIDFPFTSATLPDCVFDNEATFNRDHSGVADEGTTKCNMASPQTTPFTWGFATGETTLTVSGGGVFGLGGQFKVKELSSTRFGLAKDTTLPGSPQSVQLIVNLKH